MATEQDLAAIVVAWLRDRSWKVYQEVQCQGGVLDIAAVKDGRLWAIECKLKLGLAVLDQAASWLHQADLVSVATGFSRSRSFVLQSWMGDRGVGHLVVGTYGEGSVTEQRDPIPHVRTTDRLLEALRPEHATFCAAGSPRGGHWTEFKETCLRVSEAVREHPGATAGEIVAAVGKFHYASKASARAGIAHWAEKGKISGVRAIREGRTVRLFPQ